MGFYLVMTIASLKMYFRDAQAIFWSLMFPLVIMLIFGFLNFGGSDPIRLGFADPTGNEASRNFKSIIEQFEGDDNSVLELTTGESTDIEAQVQSGNLDVAVILPSDFGTNIPSQVHIVANAAELQKGQITRFIVDEALDVFFEQFAQVPPNYLRESTFQLTFSTSRQGSSLFSGEGSLRFVDFLVPSIAAMSIMQTAVFGSLFSLIRFKSQGVLKRLQATPVGAGPLIVGQSLSRLSIIILQTYIILILGVILFDVSLGADKGFVTWVNIGVASVVGGLMFVLVGLAVSGRLNTEGSAAPIANIITLPMLFTSGVFFPRDFLPDWMRIITEYLPLTFLVESLQQISIRGASLVDVWQELLGLFAWTVLALFAAVRLFRWE